MPRDRRILDAAALAFHEKGFHGVGMDELGTRAGLSGPSLYRYFSGKDEILAKLLDEAMDELLAATRPVDVDPMADLERALRHHVDFALANRPLVTLYQREVRSLVDPWAAAFTRRRRQYTRAWERLVSRARPELDAAVLAATTQGCLGLLFSVATWPDRTLAAPGVAEVIMDLVLRGMTGAGPDPGSAT
ncbi:TetR/AcrR family transcriptional regulator [Nocardioides nitrophenolicus]|uniref:TetR/AcrR family transcriptional regulator n=1 Tax=Nocardioides nitrophenolicus TaxID=60489 RepID=UPI0019580A67|nr:TetR/AcrR family transcriptional regulator [Nocardioides nitrophenolicus]MBM7517184.1 AcrR family transcriptional regulator [Nocardioides nitrophenolicus]